MPYFSSKINGFVRLVKALDLRRRTWLLRYATMAAVFLAGLFWKRAMKSQ